MSVFEVGIFNLTHTMKTSLNNFHWMERRTNSTVGWGRGWSSSTCIDTACALITYITVCGFYRYITLSILSYNTTQDIQNLS